MKWVLPITQCPTLGRSNYFMRRHLRVGPSCSITAGQMWPYIMQHNSVIRSITVLFPSLFSPQRGPKAEQQETGCPFLSGGGCISREECVSPSRSCHGFSPERLQQWQLVCYFLPQSFDPLIGQTLQAKTKQLCAFFWFGILFLFVFLVFGGFTNKALNAIWQRQMGLF